MRELALSRPGDPRDQLAALRLEERYFAAAVRAGEEARRSATRNDPKNAPGTLDYFARMRTLREVLILEEGWRRLDHNQSPLIVNPERTMAIGVLLGDARTGIPGNPQPRSKRPTGASKVDLVTRNQELALFPAPRPPMADDEVHVEDDEFARMATWFLLTFRYEGQEPGKVKVRSELSRAESVGNHSRIDRWQQRIMLPTLEFESVVDYSDEGVSDIDVSVEER